MLLKYKKKQCSASLQEKHKCPLYLVQITLVSNKCLPLLCPQKGKLGHF